MLRKWLRGACNNIIAEIRTIIIIWILKILLITGVIVGGYHYVKYQVYGKHVTKVETIYEDKMNKFEDAKKIVSDKLTTMKEKIKSLKE